MSETRFSVEIPEGEVYLTYADDGTVVPTWTHRGWVKVAPEVIDQVVVTHNELVAANREVERLRRDRTDIAV